MRAMVTSVLPPVLTPVAWWPGLAVPLVLSCGHTEYRSPGTGARPGHEVLCVGCRDIAHWAKKAARSYRKV